MPRNLQPCVWQHRSGFAEGFTSQHGIHRLVWMELHADRLSAIAWEKTLEEWRRAWKTALNEQDKLPA
jgi:putative endonuclease